MDNRIRFKVLAAEAAVYGMAVDNEGLRFESDYKDAADQLEKSLERLVAYSRTISQPSTGKYDPSQRVNTADRFIEPVESEIRVGPVKLRF